METEYIDGLLRERIQLLELRAVPTNIAGHFRVESADGERYISHVNSVRELDQFVVGVWFGKFGSFSLACDTCGQKAVPVNRDYECAACTARRIRNA